MNYELIDLRRREKNLTVKALCERAGIDRQTYMRIKTPNDGIRLSTFRKICNALELSPEDCLKAML